MSESEKKDWYGEDRNKITKRLRGKVVEIDVSRLRRNFELIKSRTRSKIFAVLKSSAYGHGNENIAPFIEPDGWCVGVVDEAEKIRRFSKKPVLILKGTLHADEDELADSLGNVYIVIKDMHDLERKAKSIGKRYSNTKFFLKIDTGMGRLGILPDEVDSALKIIKESGITPTIEGVISHFAFSDISDMDFVMSQVRLFDSIAGKIEREIGKKVLKTISNSAGTLALPESHFDVVRPGISLYGVSPFGNEKNFGLEPVLSVKTHVIARKIIPRGWSVGYSRRFIAQERTPVAVLGVGYADGIPRSWWEKGYVFIPKTGKKAKIIGVISMDMMCVLSDELYPGDEVELIGDNVTVYEVAKGSDTIPYEILCSVGF